MKKLLLSLTTILSIGFLFNGCDFPEYDQTTISPDFMKNVAVVNFKSDASAGASGTLFEAIDGTAVTVEGADAAMVYNIGGTKNFVINAGMVQLFLDPNIILDGDKEYNVNVVVAPAGYLKRTIAVKFSKANSESGLTYELVMLKLKSLPEAVAVATTTAEISATSGLVTPITLKASNVAAEGVSTSIAVPVGVQMKDPSGAPLAGTVAVQVVSFSDKEEGTAFFPGGLSPENIKLSDGTTGAGEFVTSGFVTIDMTVGGKTVKTFANGKAALKMTLSKDNYNPTTEKPFEVGDTSDIYSYDNEKAQWSFESVGTVKKDTDNSLYIDFETSHLSSFCAAKVSRPANAFCQRSTLTFNWAAAATTLNVRVVVFSAASNNDTWRQYFVGNNSVNIVKGTAYNVFGNTQRRRTYIVVINNGTGAILSANYYPPGTLCGNANIALNLPATSNEITVRYKATCPNSTTSSLPPVGSVLYYKPAGTGTYRTFWTVDTSNRNATSMNTTLFTVGQSYDIKIAVGAKSSVRTFNIASNNHLIEVAIPGTVCAEFGL